jgi:glycosyltransferase involved in cell wall biosynthesis
MLTILVPFYNERATIDRLIGCLQSQTYTDFCVFFLDNASTDDTSAVIEKHVQGDKRFRLRRFPRHVGPNQSFRRAVNFPGNTDYVSIRSANDFLHPNYFHDTISLLKADANVVLAYSHGLMYDTASATFYEVPDLARIDTRGLSTDESLAIVLAKYSYPFSLWGVYRADALKQMYFFENYYGADHIFVAQASILGAIASTDEKLDYKSVPLVKPSNHMDVWNSCHPLASSGIALNSSFMKIDLRVPFLSMLEGHLRMIEVLKHSDAEKQKFQDLVLFFLWMRFKDFLISEHHRLIEISQQMVCDQSKLGSLMKHADLACYLQLFNSISSKYGTEG